MVDTKTPADAGVFVDGLKVISFRETRFFIRSLHAGVT
jgi:hypothetical protein